MTTRPLGDRGSASAEFAIALPAFVLVIALGLGALTAGSVAVRLQDAAADAARLAARGEPDQAAGVVGGAVSGASAAVGVNGDLVCVTATTELRIGVLAVPLWARSCALDGGL